MPHSTNYTDTLILPAEDCRAPAASIPTKEGSVAAQQFERLQGAPYALTSDAVLLDVQATRKGVPPQERAAFEAAFFAKGQPCLRCSPLTKTFGWAIHSDAQGRVALVDPGTEQFRDLVADPAITQVHAMRNARKG